MQTPPVQVSAALQQRVEVLQLWPVPAHVPPVPQVPLVPPGGMLQASPTQQSASTVQAPALPTQGARQTWVVASHVPEQHWESTVQAFPFGAHAAHVPVLPPGADGTHRFEQQRVSVGPGGMLHAPPLATQVPGGSRQVRVSGSQVVPVQQGSGLAGVHAALRGTQAPSATAQCRTSFASGTQGAPPQH